MGGHFFSTSRQIWSNASRAQVCVDYYMRHHGEAAVQYDTNVTCTLALFCMHSISANFMTSNSLITLWVQDPEPRNNRNIKGNIMNIKGIMNRSISHQTIHLSLLPLLGDLLICISSTPLDNLSAILHATSFTRNLQSSFTALYSMADALSNRIEDVTNSLMI